MLTYPPTTEVRSVTTGEVIELFDAGWMHLDEGMVLARVIVARHRTAPGKPMTVGKLIGEWIYELFITTLDANGFLAEDVLDLYHGRGADRGQCLLTKTSKKTPIAGAPTTLVWTRTLANCVSMGVELGVGMRTEDAGREGTRPSRGRLPKKPRLFWYLRNTRLKSMAHGNGLQHLVEQLGVSVRTLSCRKRTECYAARQGQASDSVKFVKKMFLRNVLSPWPLKLIACTVLLESNA